MTNEIWIQRALAERGTILLILRESLGPNLDETTVRGVLDKLGMPVEREHLHRHMDYLEEKGYVRRERMRAMGLRMTYWSITATGRDVLMSVIDDPGVRIPNFEHD